MPLLCVIMFTIGMRACEAYLCASVALTGFLETFQDITPGETEVLKHILTLCPLFASS